MEKTSSIQPLLERIFLQNSIRCENAITDNLTSKSSKLFLIIPILFSFCTLCFSQDRKALSSLESRIENYSVQFDSLFNLNPEKTFQTTKEAMELSLKRGSVYGEAESHYQYGRYYLHKSLSDSAKYHLNMAQQKFKGLDSVFKVRLVGFYLASIENIQANYGGAQRLIAEGLAFRSNTRQDSVLQLKYINLNATVYSNLDDQKRSIEEGLKALELAILMKDKQREASALKALGSSYHYSSNHERALEYKKKALQAYKELNDMPMVGVLLNNIGNGISVMGDEKGAVPYFEESLKISEEYENFNMIAITSFCLGRSYVRLGEAEKGIPYFKRSLEISRNITKAPKTEMWALNGLGNAYNHLNSPEKAIPLLDKTIKISDSIHRKADKAVAFDYRSTSYELMGNLKASLNDARMFKIVSDSIADIERLEEIERLTVAYETEKKEAEIALQQEEIKTLNEKAKVDSLTKWTFAGGMISALALLALSVFSYRQRIRKNKIEREKQEELYRKEIEYKQKELTTQTLHLVQKNTFIQEIMENLKTIKDDPEKFKVEFRRMAMLLKKENASDKDWEVFKTYFSQVHNDFDEKLRTLFADISEKEIRLAAFLRMNLTTKEIAATMNVLPESVLKSKYRLKKKLHLDKETDLANFLKTL